MKDKILEFVERNEELFSGNKAEIKDLPPGAYNFNYLVKVNGRGFVFKLYGPDLGGLFPNKGEEEYNALKVLEGLGVAPKPVLFDSSKKFFDYDLLVYEYVEGNWIDFSETSVKKLAQALAKLHSADVGKTNFTKRDESLEGLYKGILSNFDRLKQKNTDRVLLKEVEKLVKLIPVYIKDKNVNPKFSLIHTDLAPSNIIENEEGAWMIDWQCPAIGDPAYDIWGFQSDVYNLWDRENTLTKEQRELFIKTYLDLKSDEDLRQRIKIKAPLYYLNLGIHCLRRTAQVKDRELQSQERQKRYEKYRSEAKVCIENVKRIFENEGIIHS